jgi:serine/threonine protein kinase
MDSHGEHFVVKSDVHHGVVLPDGKDPLPLGSGSIVGILGAGGMSNVYKIWCPRMEQCRAVKLMKPDLSAESRQRFQTEIRITAALSHPNIIEIHSVGEWNALSYIEMEFIDGATLADSIEKNGALPLPVCSALGILMARALVYAHDKEYVLYGKNYRGLIHRDLKPTNIMISSDGRVKLMDFGIARPVETSLMTMDGAVMGTMQYLAPEQIDGKNVGVAADLYALGAILYETITGQKAFPQKNLSHLMSAKTANTFVPLSLFKIKMPGPLKAVVQKCMQRDPQKRPHTAVLLLKQLESIHHRLTNESPEQTMLRFMTSSGDAKTIYDFRRKLPGVIPLTVAIAGTLIVAGPWFIHRQSQFHDHHPAFVDKAVSNPRVIPSDLRYEGASVAPKTKIHEIATAPPKPVPVKRAGQPLKKIVPAPSSLIKASIVAEKTPSAYDPQEKFIREAEAGNYLAALGSFEALPESAATDAAVRILHVRALVALGRSLEALLALDGMTIDDGELFLAKARLLATQGRAGEALQCVEKSVPAGARMMEPEEFRREYLFCRAQCVTKQYEQSPNEDNRKKALDVWFEVKTACRKHPDSAYFKKAVSEMQKIGADATAPERVTGIN